MSLRQKILITILSIVLLYSVYFFCIPSIVNIKKNIDYIETIVQDTSGIKINVTNPSLKMGLLPSVWLKADKFAILNKNNSEALVVENPNLEISLLKFLICKCHLTYFSADNLEANLTYKKNLNLYLGDYLIPKSNSSVLDVNHIKVNVQKYKITVIDNTIDQKSIISGDYLNVRKFIQDKRLSMASDIDILVNSNHSVVNFDVDLKFPLEKNLSKNTQYLNATVTNLDLSRFSKYLSYFTNNEYKDLKGILNFEAHTGASKENEKLYNINFIFKNFGINGKDFSQPYFYPYNVEVSSKMLARDRDVYISDLKLNAKDLSVVISGVINKINKNNPSLNLKVSAKDAKADALVDLLPPCNKLYKLANMDFDIETLVKERFFADVNFDLAIKGNPVTPDVYGDLLITNAYVTRKPIPNGAKKATIGLKFDKNKIYLDNVHVPASPTEYVDVTGWVKMYGKLKDVSLHITSTQNVDLAIAQYVLMPVHKVLGFELGPVPIMTVKGLGNIDLKVHGNKGTPHTIGIFNFKNGTVSFNDVKNMVITEVSGNLKFDDTNTIFTTKSARLNGMPVSVNGTCNLNGVLDFNVDAKNQQVNNLVKILKTSPMLKDVAGMVKTINTKSGITDFTMNLTGEVKSASDIKFGKNIFAKGKLKLHNVSATLKGLVIPITHISGDIEFDNTNLKMVLESAINHSKIFVNGEVKNNISDLKIKSDTMYADDFISYLSNSKIIPINKKASGRRGIITFNANYTGSFDKIDYSKIKVNGTASFNNYSCYYKPYKMPIEIVNANMNIKNSVLNIYSLNLKLAGMPAFAKGNITDIYNSPNMNLYIALKPNQNFADDIFNRTAIYPVKFRGEISSNTTINGILDNYDIKSTLMIGANSKIYYMGASLGDEINSTVINLDANVRKNSIYIQNLTQDKIMRTNKNRLYPTREISVSGGLKYLKNNILFDNFKIKTLTPSDSKLFNIIFKKPYIKQGLFNSDIKISGSMYNPKILGTMKIQDIDVPTHNLYIKNTDLNFQNNNIDVKAVGTIFDKPFSLKSIVANRLVAPYTVEDVKLYVTSLNLNEISNFARNSEMDVHEKLTKNPTVPFELNSLLIKNAQLSVDRISLDNILLYNLVAKATFDKNKIFTLKEFKFNTAKGQISGDYKLNLKNNHHSVSVEVSSIDAKSFTETLFNLKNQISGNLNGKMEVACTGLSQESCLKTLSGNAGFSIKNGNMPKLGSLEYLLNAANLVKGGITGLSINGLLDLISPLRTGVFESITGTIAVKNGNCNDIQIFSQGKNLNLFIKGTYNLTSSIAQMKVFGRLKRNATNILGPIGNASINALFNAIPGVDLSKTTDSSIIENINKIPAIELNSKNYRIFTVDINGNINGNDYVKSFNWIE